MTFQPLEWRDWLTLMIQSLAGLVLLGLAGSVTLRALVGAVVKGLHQHCTICDRAEPPPTPLYNSEDGGEGSIFHGERGGS